MNSAHKVELKLDWATHASAKYAVMNWHYTKKMPVSKLVKIGAWENNRFIGVVIYGLGASAQIHKKYSLKQTEICELVRIALDVHKTPVSRIIAISLRFLRKKCPGIKVVISFADPTQNHNGGIYQAGNWIYMGMSSPTREYFFNGDFRHVTDIYKRLSREKIKTLKYKIRPGKHRYLMPLDPELSKKIRLMSKPYPKRIKQGTDGHHLSSGGAAPTYALQKKQNNEKEKSKSKKGRQKNSPPCKEGQGQAETEKEAGAGRSQAD